MPTFVIEKWNGRIGLLSQIDDIFFESSTKKDFKSPAEKEAFRYKYLGYYLKNHPDLVVIGMREGRVLGYCLGSLNTTDPELLNIQPHLEIFSDSIQQYPAHLHINTHHEARGQGLGQKLVLDFEKRLQEMKITGLHIMTSPESRNRAFYARLGFDFELELSWKGGPILLMGKSLK